MRQTVHPALDTSGAAVQQRLIPLKVKILFWLVVLCAGAYGLYWLLPYPRLVVEIVRAGHVVFLLIIHR